MATIGIAGAGLLGRLLAWHLGRAGHDVDVFDAAATAGPSHDGYGAAAFSAAGMLAPTAEQAHATPALVAMGRRSLSSWKAVADALPMDAALDGVFAQGCFVQRGSILLAHHGDLGTASRAWARIGRPPPMLSVDALAALEPAVQHVGPAWHLAEEAQIHPAITMRLLHASAGPRVRWHWSSPIRTVTAHQLETHEGRYRVDVAFDVRGWGARDAFADRLRGVRGETVWLHLPAHGVSRPLRLLHPRNPIYVVPHGVDRLIVGATEIESEDRSPVSVRSALALLGAAYGIVPALAEARIERLDRNLRPAFSNNAPRMDVADGLVRINGLFRHGWLLAPALVADALENTGLASSLEYAHA